MSTEADEPEPRINPRPGVVKALGVCNLVFAVLSGLSIFVTVVWWTMARASGSMKAQPKVVASSAPPNTMVIAINPFMGMDEPAFVRFCMVESVTSLVVACLMFATGIGLFNLRRWGAQGWTYLAWAKIALVAVLWGYFIVAVAPVLSENMARNMAKMMQQSSGPRPGPTVEMLTMVYSVMNLILALVVILVSSIYPAISLWLLGRPGVKAALIDTPARRLEHP